MGFQLWVLDLPNVSRKQPSSAGWLLELHLLGQSEAARKGEIISKIQICTVRVLGAHCWVWAHLCFNIG